MTAYADYAATLSLYQNNRIWKGNVNVAGGSNMSAVGGGGSVVDGFAWGETGTSTNPHTGDAVQLNGSSQAYRIPKEDLIAVHNAGSSSHSLIMWVKKNSAGNPASIMASGAGSFGANIFWLSPTGNASFGNDTNVARVIFYGSTQSDSCSFNHGGRLSDGQWHMIGWVYTTTGTGTGTLSLVVDGLIKQTVTLDAADTPDTLANDFSVGSYNNGSDSMWMAYTFDYVSLHAKALSATELANLYDVFLGFKEYSGGTLTPVIFRHSAANIQLSPIGRMRTRQQISRVLALGVGDSQMVRNVGADGGAPFRNSDQGFTLTDDLMLSAISRGRPLAGMVSAPFGPDGSNGFILGVACWNTAGLSGSASPPTRTTLRSLVHLSPSDDASQGFRLGFYHLNDAATVDGAIAKWLIDPAQSRWAFGDNFKLRATIPYQRFSSGTGEMRPSMYVTSDSTILAGDAVITTAPASDDTTPQLLILTSTVTNDEEVAVSLSFSGGVAGTVAGPMCIGTAFFENVNQTTGFVYGVMYAYGGRDLHHTLIDLDGASTDRTTILENTFTDLLGPIDTDTANRMVAFFLHTGANIATGTYDSLDAYANDYSASAYKAYTYAGYKLELTTFMETMRAMGESVIDQNNLLFIHGPYMAQTGNHRHELLVRAAMELADSDPNFCCFVGKNIVPANELSVGAPYDNVYDDGSFTHLNENGFDQYGTGAGDEITSILPSGKSTGQIVAALDTLGMF